MENDLARKILECFKSPTNIVKHTTGKCHVYILMVNPLTIMAPWM